MRSLSQRARLLRIGAALAVVAGAGAGIGAALAAAGDNTSGVQPAAAPRATAGATAARTTVRVLAVGDFGVGGDAQARVGAAIRDHVAERPTDVLATLGDNDYSSGRTFHADWEAAFGWVDEQGLAVAGVLGNHDIEFGDGGAYEFEALGMPAAWYTRRIGEVELFVLDSNRVDDEQTAWLEKALQRSQATWKVALMHHPPFNCAKHGSDIRTRAWVPLFERYGVQLVLGGHEHSYQRFLAERGVTYVVHGGGGQRLYRLQPCGEGFPERARARRIHGFLELEFQGDRAVVSAWNRARRLVDRAVVPLDSGA